MKTVVINADDLPYIIDGQVCDNTGSLFGDKKYTLKESIQLAHIETNILSVWEDL